MTNIPQVVIQGENEIALDQVAAHRLAPMM
jgi:hypothetical protein